MGYGDKEETKSRSFPPNGGSRATPYPVPQREGDGKKNGLREKKIAKDLELTNSFFFFADVNA
jgi:hypothetical protein